MEQIFQNVRDTADQSSLLAYLECWAVEFWFQNFHAFSVVILRAEWTTKFGAHNFESTTLHTRYDKRYVLMKKCKISKLILTVL